MMDSDAFDEFLRLGTSDEFLDDYAHVFDSSSSSGMMGVAEQPDQLSLILNDLDRQMEYAGDSAIPTDTGRPGLEPATRLSSCSEPSPLHYEAGSSSSSSSHSDDSGNHSPTSSDGARDVEMGMAAALSPWFIESNGSTAAPRVGSRHSPQSDTSSSAYSFLGRRESSGTETSSFDEPPPRAYNREEAMETSHQRASRGAPRTNSTMRREYATTKTPSASINNSTSGQHRAQRPVILAQQQQFHRQQLQPHTLQSTSQGQQRQLLYIMPASTSSAQTCILTPRPAFAYAAVKTEPTGGVVVHQPTVLLAQPAHSVPMSHVTTRTALVTPIKVDYTEPYDEEFARKQEDRKVKNRAAAQQSRLKRRTELENLRCRVMELEQENDGLVKENSELKHRLARYESASMSWRMGPPRKRVAAGACLLVFLVMVAFQPFDRNLSPFQTSESSSGGLPHGIPYNSGLEAQPEGIAGKAAESRVIRSAEDEKQPNSRTLLAVEDYDVRPQKSFDDYEDDVRRGVNGTDCKEGVLYPNQTETIRLNRALDSWIMRHDRVEWLEGKNVFFLGRAPGTAAAAAAPPGTTEKQQGNDSSQRPPSNITAPEKPMKRKSKGAEQQSAPVGGANSPQVGGANSSPRPAHSSRAESKREAARERAMRDRAWKHLDMVSRGGIRDAKADLADRVVVHVPVSPSQEVLLRPDKQRRALYEKLAATVQQRTDTLYVVAMSDYLLLPAIERNATTRPRVSLILPALNNGTVTNQVVMMRIDLDVMGTGLINLADAFLPIFNNFSIF